MTDTRVNRIRLMSSVSRYEFLVARLSWFVCAATALAGLMLWHAYHNIPSIPEHGGNPVILDVHSNSASVISCDWTVFQSQEGGATSGGGISSSRFRLAGTFFEYVSDVSGTGDVRRAIIDDLRRGSQVIVREGDKIEETTTIIKIFRDRVVMRDAGGSDEQLWLTFSGFGGPSSKVAVGTNDIAGTSDKGENGDKFGGKQIGADRWLFSREKLLDYYKELRDDPERLVKVFDSLKPVYEAKGRIGGYRLGIEGEPEFFKASGLEEGDVVRSVNSMPMSNRHRAEYFIQEFVADRANAFVLEIQRQGQDVKLIYQVR